MGKKIDLSGMKFGRLTVLCENGRKRGEICWKCQCDCGNIINVSSYSLRIGETKSCGCYQKERTSKANTIHGDAETSLWRRWVHMIDRCERSSCKDYKNYGGRGIKVCPEWKESYTAFKEWSLENGYEEKLTIDRIDVDGDYSPDNCRWVTIQEQQRNRRDTIKLTFSGVEKTASEWARIACVSPAKIYYRKRMKWTDEQIEEYLFGA